MITVIHCCCVFSVMMIMLVLVDYGNDDYDDDDDDDDGDHQCATLAEVPSGPMRHSKEAICISQPKPQDTYHPPTEVKVDKISFPKIFHNTSDEQDKQI